jgi:two-component system sensor histidine kinase YesM
MIVKELFQGGAPFSIKTKIIVFFLVLGLVPILILGLISYRLNYDSLHKNVETYSFEVIERTENTLETYISDIKNILKFKDDYYFKQYLLLYKSGDIEGNRKYMVKIWETFDTVKKIKTDLSNIRMIDPTGHVISYYGTYWEELKDNPLYKSLLKKSYDEIAVQPPHQDVYNKNVFTVGKVMDRGNSDELGMICVDIDANFLNKLCRNTKLGDKGYVYLAAEDGSIAFVPQGALNPENIGKIVESPKLLSAANGTFMDSAGGVNYLVTYKTSKSTGWKIVGVTPQTEVIAGIRKTSQIYYWLIPTIMLIVLLLSLYVTSILTNPIRELRSVMKQAAGNDLSIHARIKTRDEIGQLAESFNKMLNRIRELMDNVVEDQLKIRKMEMKAMQEMIKPHFVYNTLDSIIGLLEQNRNSDAMNLIGSLGKFFRTSLSHGREMVLIQEELDHIKSYLTIQQFRFSNKFDYIFEVDNEVYRFKTIKLILQPLVENSIYHGIRNSGRRGLILIKGFCEGGEILFEIIDNGEGIPKDRIDTINRILRGEEAVTDENLYFGLRNVNERIKLNFGRNYGLRFDDKIPVGARIIVNLPMEK